MPKVRRNAQIKLLSKVRAIVCQGYWTVMADGHDFLNVQILYVENLSMTSCAKCMQDV